MTPPQYSNYERAARSVFILLLTLGIYVWVGHTILRGEFHFWNRYDAASLERITPGSHPLLFWSWQAGWIAAALLLDFWCIRDLIRMRRTATG